MSGEHIGISELELLSRQKFNGSAETNEKVRAINEHIRECNDCAEIAEAFRTLDADHCPLPDAWAKLIANLLPEEEEAALLQHAQCCNKCAGLLRETLPSDAEFSLEEEVAAMESSTPEWQAKMAQVLAQNVTPYAGRHSSWWIRLWTPVVWVPVAAALLLAGLVLGFRTYEESDMKLLAATYDEHRVTDARLVAGDPVDRAPENRGNDRSRPLVSLSNLLARTATKLQANPNDSYWLQMQGRAELLQHNSQHALEDFQSAAIGNPNLPGLTFDIGAAEFEKAESESSLLSYGAAADTFGKVIDGSGPGEEKAAAYYNRGLCNERRGQYWDAGKDYEKALALGVSSRWRDEAAKALARVKKITEKSENYPEPLIVAPEEFLRAVEEGDANADDYELYLIHASKEWISHRDGSTYQAALQRLAEFGKKHGDAWLSDFLQTPQTEINQRATAALEAGLRDSSEGEADTAMVSLEEANKLFRQADNAPGELRTGVEIVYSMHRMGKSAPCRRIAARLQKNPRIERYTWIHARLLLEIGACRGAEGELTRLSRDTAEALSLAQMHQLNVEMLRAEGFKVENLDDMGQREEALKLARQGLSEAAGSRGTSMRSYQFLFAIYDSLREQGLTKAAANSAEEANHFARRVHNLQTRAYAEEVLGVAETAADHPRQADEAFDAASQVLKKMSAGDAHKLYTADWETDRCKLLAREGKLPEALERMQKAEDGMHPSQNYDVRQKHYTEFAALLLGANNPERALKKVQFATHDAELALENASTEKEKISWDKDYGRGYRLMVQCLLAEGKEREALKVWEWYRAAPYRIAGRKAAHLELLTAAQDIPPERQRNLTLVVANLDDFYVTWAIVPGQALRVERAGANPQQIAWTASVVAHLCADRASSPEEISAVGEELYRELLGKFDKQVDSAGTIFLDRDSSLQEVPFAALTRSNHRYLIDTHALVMLPRWWTLRPPEADTIPMTAKALFVEGSVTAHTSESGGSVSLPTETLEARELATRFQHAVLVRQGQSSVPVLRRQIPLADIFHFSGHSFTSAGRTGLLLRYPDTIFDADSLEGVRLPHLRMAVIAACSSAGIISGTEDDTSSLAHTLLRAGAGNVVATLWDVDSEASRRMMLQMYDSLSSGRPIAEALHTAQLRLKSGPEYGHPFFWASMQDFSQ